MTDEEVAEVMQELGIGEDEARFVLALAEGTITGDIIQLPEGEIE